MPKSDDTLIALKTVLEHFKGDFNEKDVISKAYVIDTIETVVTAAERHYSDMEGAREDEKK